MKKLLCLLVLPLSMFAQNDLIIENEHSGRPLFKVYTDSSQLWFNGQLNMDSCRKRLSLYVYRKGYIAEFPVGGTYHLAGDKLQFQPSIELDRSLKFVICTINRSEKYKPGHGQSGNLEPPSSVGIYPSSKLVPANILCFYLEFNQEMQPDEQAYKYVKVAKDGGKSINFLWRQKSFWINDGRILVLMIHPGRVKNGIHATSDLEPAFIPGSSYHLTIEKGLAGKNGMIMKRKQRFSFTVTYPDTTLPVFDKIMNEQVEHGSKMPLKISFTDTMDYGLAMKWLKITNGDNEVPGNWETSDGRHWDFIPSFPWERGNYHLVLFNKLSDLAHNQMDRKFEERFINNIQADNAVKIPFIVN